MALVCLEVSCAPNGEERYPVPTTVKIVRIFADAREAAKEFPDDRIHPAESEYGGQDVYFVLWKTDDPLNIDRCATQGNNISNCGMWLPQSERVYGNVTDLEVELIAPQRIRPVPRSVRPPNAPPERTPPTTKGTRPSTTMTRMSMREAAAAGALDRPLAEVELVMVVGEQSAARCGSASPNT